MQRCKSSESCKVTKVVGPVQSCTYSKVLDYPEICNSWILKGSADSPAPCTWVDDQVIAEQLLCVIVYFLILFRPRVCIFV